MPTSDWLQSPVGAPRGQLWSPTMQGRINAVNRLAYPIAAAVLVSLIPVPQSAAEPATVGTAVNVVMHTSFEQTSDADQCVGAGTLAAVRRGASVVLMEGSSSSDSRKVAVGQFFRSRLNDGGVCQVLYITSAPVMPSFNVQFVGPEGGLEFGVRPEPVRACYRPAGHPAGGSHRHRVPTPTLISDTRDDAPAELVDAHIHADEPGSGQPVGQGRRVDGVVGVVLVVGLEFVAA